MSDSTRPLTDQELDHAFDGLDSTDRDAIREALADTSIDPTADGKVDELLRGAASLGAGAEVPPIPDSALAMFEKSKAAALAEVAKEDAELESTIYSQPRRYEDPEEKVARGSFFSRFKLPLGVAGVAAAAAAVAIALFLKPGSSSVVAPVYAENVSLLTPGETTGFAEPVFTWKSGNDGAANLEILSPEGKTVAKLENAYSPVRWNAIPDAQKLQPGAQYRIRLSSPDMMLAERMFAIGSDASAGPEPAGDLDGIVAQCEQLLAENRPADAWMLWAELTADQKSDPRMQDLKIRIMQQIAG